MIVLQTASLVLVLVLVIEVVHRRQARQLAPQTKSRRPGRSRTCRPDCPACQAEEHQPERPPRPAPRVKQKAGRPRSVNTSWHYCPNKRCSHYGWVGLDNIVSNGHPNSGHWRQLCCTVCGTYFMETIGCDRRSCPWFPRSTCHTPRSTVAANARCSDVRWTQYCPARPIRSGNSAC